MIIYLIGLPGVGKSYWGKHLASALNLRFIDLDAYIESSCKRSIPQIFKEDNESGFRKIESNALEKVSLETNVVVATGGGTPCFHNNLAQMKRSGITLYIKDDLSAIANRLLSDSTNRPLFGTKNREEAINELLNLLADRGQYYEQTHIITGIEAFNHMHLLTNRLELFTKT